MLSTYCISVTTHFVCNHCVVDCCIIFLVVVSPCDCTAPMSGAWWVAPYDDFRCVAN
nr:MAG TPA: hypothetical protein [Bacteriophage sp.]